MKSSLSVKQHHEGEVGVMEDDSGNKQWWDYGGPRIRAMEVDFILQVMVEVAGGGL